LDFSSRGEITIAREIRVISARSVSHVIDKSDVISAFSSAFLARELPFRDARLLVADDELFAARRPLDG